MARQDSNLPAVMSQGRKAGRREGRRKIYGVFVYQHACAFMHKKITFFNKDFNRH